jgi:hypothetical protein
LGKSKSSLDPKEKKVVRFKEKPLIHHVEKLIYKRTDELADEEKPTSCACIIF